MAHDVVITCAPQDQSVAEALSDTMQAAGVRCWLPWRGATAGTGMSSASRAMEESRLVILIWSGATTSSPNVLDSVAAAARRHRPVLGFRLEPTRRPDVVGVAADAWVDGFPAPVERFFPEVVQAALELLGQRTGQTWTSVPPPAASQPVASAPVLPGALPNAAPPRSAPVPSMPVPSMPTRSAPPPPKSASVTGRVAGAFRRGLERIVGRGTSATPEPPNRGVSGSPPIAPAPAGSVPAPVPADRSGPESPAVAAPAPDPVFLATAAPRTVFPGDRCAVDIVAYVKRTQNEAAAVLRQQHPEDDIAVGRKTGCRWASGTHVLVRLASPHFVVEPPTREFTWDGEWAQVTFTIEVPDDATARRTTLDGTVHVAGVCVADFTIQIEIATRASDKPSTPQPAAQTEHGPVATSAFASYSSADRNEVLRRLASIRASTGLDIFVDCVSLRSGQEWAPALEREIGARDRFLLFWCRHAHDSEWVRREYELALKLKGIRACEIHPLEPVGKDMIPEQLQQLHFGDVFLYAAGYDPNHPVDPSSRGATAPPAG